MHLHTYMYINIHKYDTHVYFSHAELALCMPMTWRCSRSQIIRKHPLATYSLTGQALRGYWFQGVWLYMNRYIHICGYIETEWRIYASGNHTITGSDNGMLPVRRQAIDWTIARILLIGPWGANFSEVLIKIHTFSLRRMHLKMSSVTMATILPQPQCVKIISHQ